MTSPYPPGDPANPQQGGQWPPPAPQQYPPPQQYPGAPQQYPPPQQYPGAPQYPYVPERPQPPTQQFPPQPYDPAQAPYDPAQPPSPVVWNPGDQAAPYGPVAQPPAKKRGVGKKILSVVSALLVVGVIIVIKVGARDVLDRIFDGGSEPSSVAAPTGPFEDTPAASYPEGEAGIELPAATPVPGFTAAQVTAGLENVKKAMVAARLDPTMLVSHDASTFVNLFAPQTREDVKKSFTEPDFFAFATYIAPDQSLRNEKVRVKGTVTFNGGTVEGIRVLYVKTNFVWVYPFTGDLKTPGDHLVVVRDENTWAFLAEADVQAKFRGMYLDSSKGYASNVDCDLLDKSLLALGKPLLVPRASPGDGNAVYDPNHSLDFKDTC